MATKKELKARIALLETHIEKLQHNASALRTAALVLEDLKLKEGRRQVLDEVYGDREPGLDVYEAHKLHINRIYGRLDFRGGYTHVAHSDNA